LNGAAVGNFLVLQANDTFYAERETLQAWRLFKEPSTKLAYSGSVWFSLREFDGYKAVVNEETQTLDLSFAASSFLSTQLGQNLSKVVYAPIEPVFVLSYDLTASYVKSLEQKTASFGGLLAGSYSNRLGLFSSSWVGSAQSRSASGSRGSLEDQPVPAPSISRLETSFTKLFVDHEISLRVGDTLSRSSATGGAFFYGGVQLVSSPGLVPGTGTRASPFLAGAASAAGNLQVYVNGVLQQTNRIPAGPFSLNNAPSVDGEGNVRLVVTDVLGRETVINQRLFNYPGLLPVGFAQWALDGGLLRVSDSGSGAIRYTDPVATGYYRRGLWSRLTAEARLGVAPGFVGVGVSTTLALPWRTLGTTTLAGSQLGSGQRGQETSLELTHRTGAFSAALRYGGASSGYAAIGSFVPGGDRRQISLALGYQTERFGGGGLNFSEIDTADGRRQAVAGFNYSARVGSVAFLNLSVNHILASGQAKGTTSAFTSLAVPLGARTSVVTQGSLVDGSASKLVSFQQAPQRADGYFMQGSLQDQGGQVQGRGSVAFETQRAFYNAEITASQAVSGIRAGVRGGAVLIGGTVALAKTGLGGGVALVDAPKLPGVGVLRNGTVVTQTDQKGRAVVVGLAPFTNNQIQLNAEDLPLDLDVDNLEQSVAVLDRMGAVVRFKVLSGRPALLTVFLDDGEFAPAGAQVKVRGREEIFYVARRGEAYVAGLEDDDSVEITWRDQVCRVPVRLPPGSGASGPARVGPLICSGVRR
jgi:outer membrane usher protein